MRDIRKLVDSILELIPHELSGMRYDIQCVADDSKYYPSESDIPFIKLGDLLTRCINNPSHLWELKVWSIYWNITVDEVISDMQLKGVNINNLIVNSKIKLWIARDFGIYDDDGNIKVKGKLHLFHSAPEVGYDKFSRKIFTNARSIAELPSYLYPEIKEGDCYQFDGDLYYNDFNKI